jgi:hypothetical protein
MYHSGEVRISSLISTTNVWLSVLDMKSNSIQLCGRECLHGNHFFTCANHFFACNCCYFRFIR